MICARSEKHSKHTSFRIPEKTQGLSQKTQGIYFKIQGTYFKISALYFSPFQAPDKQQLTKSLQFAVTFWFSIL